MATRRRKRKKPASKRSTQRSVPPRTHKRSGVTAMEYVVVISFILVVLITVIQQFGSMTGNMFQNNANKTAVMGQK